MEQNTKVTAILEALKGDYPEPRCALEYQKDYELMVAVRLSAQCTDARVNEVTPALFAAYPSLEALAEADISHVEELVHSCGFYKNKAREIVLACRMLLTDYGGKVPGTMEELLKLPGVGRKTANLLLGDLYGAPGAVVCDPTASGFPTAWAWPRGRSRRRWNGSFGLFSPLRRAPTFATVWCSMAGQFAPPEIPNAPSALWPPGAPM